MLPMMQGENGALFQARVTLWDNDAGRAVGVRRIQGSNERHVGTREGWRDAAADFARELLRAFPLAERETN